MLLCALLISHPHPAGRIDGDVRHAKRTL